MGEKVTVVDKAGPGVLRMQPAIMRVSVKKAGMSALDIVPIHLLFTAAKSASGGEDMDVSVLLEARITDSVSGENRGAARTTLTGEQLKGSKAMLTLQSLQKALDKAAEDGASGIGDSLGD